MKNSMKKEMLDKYESRMALNEKLSNVESIMRQKALQDEEALKAAGLYEYMDNECRCDIEVYLHMQVIDWYCALIDVDKKNNEEAKDFNELTPKEQAEQLKYIYQTADMFAKALKDYCVYRLIKG